MYNRTSLPDVALDHGLATHQYIRIDGPILLHNPFYEDPEKAANRQANPHEVKEKFRYIDGER